MHGQDHGAIAAFGYRRRVNASLSAFVKRIEAAMQTTDDRPVAVTWVGDDVAILDLSLIHI